MSKIFAKRRRMMMEHMQDGVAIIPAAPVRSYGNGLEYSYVPDSNFYYLTGYGEPEAIALLIPGAEAQFILFVRDNDSLAETWFGKRSGVKVALENYGADAAYPICEFGAKLPELINNKAKIYYRFGVSEYDGAVLNALATLRGRMRLGFYPPRTIIDPDLILSELRLFKNEAEDIELFRKACQITSEAHVAALKKLPLCTNEADLEGEFYLALRRLGAERVSFNTIVAAGANACTLHYEENRAALKNGDLVLIDAGAQYQGWCGDISRTYPINGTFTKEQAELYEIVLEAHRVAIAASKPGTTLDAIMAESVKVLSNGLVRLGFFPGKDVETVIAEGLYKEYFMHRVSHWLGLDCHDVGDYHIGGKARIVDKGMAFSIEPGLYVAPHTSAPERYKGIGIRIEDDVLLTENGCEVLTSVPKEIEEIETILAKAQKSF